MGINDSYKRYIIGFVWGLFTTTTIIRLAGTTNMFMFMVYMISFMFFLVLSSGSDYSKQTVRQMINLAPIVLVIANIIWFIA